MTESHIPVLVLIVGALVVLSIGVKAALDRVRIPALVGFMLLGFGLRVCNDRFGILGATGLELLDVLAQLGIIVLLFRVGLESNLPALLGQLRSASLIWSCGIVLSLVAGYAAARWILGQGHLAGLTVATAFTATSVGIPVRVWRNHDALDTPTGERFLDAAELDDISGVLLMALLLAMIPELQSSAPGDVWAAFAATLAKFVALFVAFCGLCFLFSKHLEERITNLIEQLEAPPNPAIVVAGIGIVIAAVAGLLGFSMAVGAFFAGLVFSRDPDRVRLDASFGPLYEFLAPFFFVGIGLLVSPGHLVAAVGLGAVLLVFAVLSKLIGHGVPAWRFMSLTGAAVLGVSMVPRAEITLVIMKKGHALGDAVVPDALFSAMVFVSAATATLAPLVLHRLLDRYKNVEGVL